MQCRLSALPTNRRVSWLSPKNAVEFVGRSDAETRVLLLPTLRHRLVSVGPRRGPNGQTTDACAERAVSLAGLLTDSFEEAAEKVLPELSGLHLAETTVQRTTEAAGTRLGEHLGQGKVIGGPTPWKWYKDAEGKTCAYTSVDATGVRQQACGGGPAEGRMPYVGMIYNAVPELPKGSPHAPPAGATMQARYVAGLYSLDELSEVMRRQGCRSAWIEPTAGSV